MTPNIVTLEPERQHKLMRWWNAPETATLMECLDKARMVKLLEASELQAKSVGHSENANFHESALEKLKEAADYETAISVLKAFLPDGPFIARIEL